MSSPATMQQHRDRSQHRARQHNNQYQEQLTSRYRIGTKILKRFEDGKLYEGKVVGYKDNFYRIYYDADNDSEDMDHDEVRKYLKYKRTTQSVGSSLVQRTLAGDVITIIDSETFGHEYPSKPNDNCTVITFQNIGPQPQSAYSITANLTATAFKVSKASVALYAEHGLNERRMRKQEQFFHRMRRINEGATTYVSNNTTMHPYHSWHIPGGTALTVDTNLSTHKAQQGSGRDETGLGRWTWVRFRGKNSIHTIVISAYRPCKNCGPTTAWTQQVNYFRENNYRSPNPRELFDSDLCKELEKWIARGDNIVLGIDMNEDARHGALAKQLKTLNMRDLILTTHATASPPATHDRNQSRIPIDAIWGTSGVEVERAGYCPFNQEAPSVASDHRMLWVEVSSLSILGKDIPHSSKAINCSRLHSKDPRSRRLYQKTTRRQYKRQHLFKSYKKLSQWRKQYRAGNIDNHNHFVSKFERRFNQFHASTRKIRSATARFGATVKAGKCHWSPKYMELTDRIKLWRSVIRWKKGCSTSRKKLKKLAHNTHTDWSEIQLATDATATDKHHAARKHY